MWERALQWLEDMTPTQPCHMVGTKGSTMSGQELEDLRWVWAVALGLCFLKGRVSSSSRLQEGKRQREEGVVGKQMTQL